MARTKIIKSSFGPRCSDPLNNYGIGNCAGCERFPVVLYKEPTVSRWRCAACYQKNVGQPPQNLVML